MPHNLFNLADGGTALRNNRTARDAFKVTLNDGHSFAGAPNVRMFDDFLGDVIADQWGVNKGSDGSAVNFAVLAGAVGGALEATTGADAGGTMALNGVQLHSYLQWKANSGGLVFEVRVKIEAITTGSLFVGLTDQIAGLEAPVVSAASADTITTNATDAVGFMFDTAMTTDNIWLVGVANDTDATKQDTGIAPVADTYNTYRIEVNASGGATFYLDGNQVGTAIGMAGAVTASVALTPVITYFRRAATATKCTADYLLVQCDRV